jgi:hypothetical protein
MERKEELPILIETLKKDIEVSCQKISDFETEASELMSEKLSSIFNIPADNIKKVKLTRQSMELVLHSSLEKKRETVEITIYNKSYSNDDYRLSWFTTQATKDDVLVLIYLEALGKIATDMRTDKIILGFLGEFLEKLKPLSSALQKDQHNLSNAESELHELQTIETFDDIFNKGGIVFSKPQKTFIKSKDRFASFVKKIGIEHISKKTITLVYLDDDDLIIDRTRFDLQQGKRVLVGYHKFLDTEEV